MVPARTAAIAPARYKIGRLKLRRLARTVIVSWRVSRRTARRASGALASLAIVLFSLAGAWTPVHAQPRSSSRPFWVARAVGWSHARYTLLAHGPHVNLYARLADHVPFALARSIVTTVERHILPEDRRLFGTPRGMFPVDIVLARLDAMTLGYFDPNDVNPSSSFGDPGHTNRANAVYVRLPATMPDRNKFQDTCEVIAHELQHLISYRLRVLERHVAAEEDWLNEGLSFYAQLANGYWTRRDLLKARAAAANPSWPVTSLYESVGFLRGNGRLAYGRAGAFVTYLATRFGPAFVRGLEISNLVGLQAVDSGIRARSPRLDLPSVFGDWGVADYLRWTGLYGYGALDGDMRLTPALAVPEVTIYPFDSQKLDARRFLLRPWGQEYFSFAGYTAGQLQIDVRGSIGRLRVAAILQDTDGHAPPRVHWLTFHHGGVARFCGPAFGSPYDRVTVAVSAVSAPAEALPPQPVTVSARLVDMGDHNGVTRPAAAARHHANLPVLHLRQFDQLLPVWKVNPESARIAARYAERAQSPGCFFGRCNRHLHRPTPLPKSAPLRKQVVAHSMPD